MTNRDWLMTLSDFDLAKFIIEVMPIIWRGYNHNVLGLASWLKDERGGHFEV